MSLGHEPHFARYELALYDPARTVRFIRAPLCQRCPLKTSAEPALAMTVLWSGCLASGCFIGFGSGLSHT